MSTATETEMCDACDLKWLREQHPAIVVVRVNLHDDNGPVRVFMAGRFVRRYESLPRSCTC